MRCLPACGLAAGVVAAVFLAAAPAPASGAGLPQEHAYQEVLRTYLGTLTAEDLAVSLEPVTLVEDSFESLDEWARYWMLEMEGQHQLPKTKGLRVAAEAFTLDAIEAGDTVNMSPDFANPVFLSWWAQWAYPGNPYHQSDAVKRRALVSAMVDMMMLDQVHAAGEFRRSDYLGGNMIRYAYAYYIGGGVLPEPVQEAYEAGLARMFEKLERWEPRGQGGSDMEFFQLVGMWYAAQALGGNYPERALARAHHVIDTVTSETGHELHGGAFDVSYQGIALRFLTWAAMLYDDPQIDEALHKMLVLKAHLTLPEPDGTMFGPTHFNTGTAMDAPHDQWDWVSRDLAMAMIDDTAMYTIWARVGVPQPEAMTAQVRKFLGGIKVGEPLDDQPKPWTQDHWQRTINFAFENYHPGFYQQLLELDAAEAPITKPPFGRGRPFIRDLNGGGEFLAARLGGYGAIIHTGPIASEWATGVSGKSGGSLSAFWTPARGTAILGRTRATQSKTSDQWTDENGRGPYTWAVHAITGRSKDGSYFSTSRIRDTESAYRIEGDDRAVVRVRGDLAGSPDADPADVLSGTAQYAREFVLEKDGLTITSGVRLEHPEEVAELWEVLPVFVAHRKNSGEIAFRVDGQWQPASEEVVLADRIRLSMYGNHADVVLDQPMPVRLGPAHAEGREFGQFVTLRNVMIDLMQADDHRIHYRIVAGGALATDEP